MFFLYFWIDNLMPVIRLLSGLSLLIIAAASLQAQPSESLDRLPADVLDVRSPIERVEGTPGSMRITDRSCRSMPLSDVRRRIVDTAVQEWAYFGFSVDDQLQAQPFPSSPSQQSPSQQSLSQQMQRGSFPRMNASEGARVASSIAVSYTHLTLPTKRIV